MIYFLLFIFELILLFLLSKKLINCLAQVMYKITKSHHVVVNTLAIIFLPGTIIHELAHLLFAGVLLVPVGEMRVLPEIDEDKVKLGSVQIGKTDLLRRTIVGVAPALLGLFCILAIFLFIPFGNGNVTWWQNILALYLVFEIGNTMFSSKKDLEGVIGFVVAILILVIIGLIVLYFLNPEILKNAWILLKNLDLGFAISFFKQADTYLIIPLILDIVVILLTIPLIRRRQYV